MHGHTGKLQSKMSRQDERELWTGDFIVFFEKRNGRSKVSKWNKLMIG